MTLKPHMPQQEIAVMEALFAFKRPRRVLEYGAGGSTLRWSRVRSVEEWVSVEHSEEWYRKVGQAVAIYHAPVTLLTGHATDADCYVNAPGIRPPYDLIFVDGLFRVECVRNAPELLAEHGVLVLHDAGRAEYHECWDTFPNLVHLTHGDGLRDGLMVMWR